MNHTSSLLRAAVLVPAVVLALAGCASHEAERPTLLPAPPGLSTAKVALITIYRPEQDFGASVNPTVALNGSDLISPHRNTIFTARLLPGEYRFTVDDDRAGTLRAAAGHHYYFQLIIQPGKFSGNARLGIVSPEQAADESAHLVPADKDDVENRAFR
jgi:hypothetical protein